MKILSKSAIIISLLILITISLKAADKNKKQIKHTQDIMNQYETSCYADSSLVYLMCKPDYSDSIHTYHGKFAICGVQKKWIHAKPSYEGFKTYLDSLNKK